MLDCPVCAKTVDRATAPTSVYQGITYYLRCQGCKVRFDADPEHFLRGGPDGCGRSRDGGHGDEATAVRFGPRSDA